MKTITVKGHSFNKTLVEMRAELNEWIAQLKADGLHGEALYNEMCDWVDDNIMLDKDRVGYEDKWPLPVTAIIRDNGDVELS